MDEIMHLPEPSKYEYSEERIEIQDIVNRIRVMLWAGDIGFARSSVNFLEEKYRPILRKALAVKQALTTTYRNELQVAKAKLREKGLRGRDLERQVQEKIAHKLHVESYHDDALYLLSPLAATVEALKRRIGEGIDEQTSVLSDSNTNFRIATSNIGINSWESRGYHFSDLKIDPEVLVKNLNETLKATLVNLDSESNQFPIWLRVFSDKYYLEIKFYRENRFSLSIIASHESEIRRVQDLVLGAYEKSVP